MINESSAKRMLKALGFMDTGSCALTDLEQAVLDIQSKQNIAYAGPLAGYSRGLARINQSNILVTNSPSLIQAKSGQWPIISALLEGMLNDPIEDQRPYLYGWLRVGVEALYQGKIRPGQALCFAGEAESGKSLVQAIITEILGGRAAKPYQFMTGGTSFNSDAFEAEHLMIEDESASTDIRARRAFGAQLKQITASLDQRCHAKNRTGLVLRPFWRLTISVNDEPENLMVLPPIDPSIEDKIMLFKVHKNPMPMPTSSLDEREAFWRAIVAELPAFLDFILNWTIPPHLMSSRYGITHYHHPEILGSLDELAPEIRLLAIIDQALLNHGKNAQCLFQGSAEELEQKLVGACSAVRPQAARLLGFTNACGVYLGRLRKRPNARVTSRTITGHTEWTILPPPPIPNTSGTSTSALSPVFVTVP